MTKAMKLYPIFVVFLVSFGIALCLVIIESIQQRNRQPVIKLVPYVDPNYVQTPAEAQSRLKRQGYYHGKIDGIWGPNTDKAYCDWCAVNEFKRWEIEE